MVILHEISEKSSSSSTTHRSLYDVFLSFRGVDTRHGFTNHLHNALMHASISTFLDDEEIETSEDLKPELESAIKASKASVIVLSQNYATSTWCLDELVQILEQRKTSNHIVIPIFYHVEPTHVRKQQSSFGDAMAKHRQRMDAETDENKRSQWAQKIDRWNKALREVADLKGKDANGRLEVELIDEIVNVIFRRLRISSRFPLPQLTGIDDSLKFVTSWLKDASSHTTNILTIWGMGGIGKTSLAKYVYALHSHEFRTHSFIEDIGRRCDEKSNGMFVVQKQLYDDILKPSPVRVHDNSIYTSMIENTIARKKVYLVLDDIGSLDQLDALLGHKGLHPGSIIIITTKDAWLTKSCALFKTDVIPRHETYELKVLSEIDSQKLLCFHAFMCNDPKVGYEEVSKKLVKYCEGHPMALKVLGRSLYNRDVTYWEGYIESLKKENGSPINNVLKMSFDSLPFKNDKELFKHISCFFVGMERDVTETILNACGINTRSGITNLIDRCLLSINQKELVMHQLVQEMGRFLVREESPDKPWKRSRLWCHESFKVLKQKKGTENVLGLTLDMKMIGNEKLHGSSGLKTDALSKMDSLMLLQLNYVQINGSYENFPEELRWLCMNGFPLKSVPSDLLMENLVALDMSYSNIESFGICYSNPQRLHKRQKLIGPSLEYKTLPRSLKILNLSYCEQLRSVGSFDQLTALERLILTGCVGLLEVCESIEHCVELFLVDLSYCSKLEKLPRIIDLVEKLKTSSIGMNTITSYSATLEVIPSDLKFFTIPLPRSLVRLSLANNNLSNESFPKDFSCLSMLEDLSLNENPIVSLPSCVKSLPRLRLLNLENCYQLTSVEHPPNTLREIGIYSDSYKPALRKVVLDGPMNLALNWNSLLYSSFEIEGMFKVQPMADVEETVLRALGWTKPDFLIGRRLEIHRLLRREEIEIQMYYEFGIFSTIYRGEEMPDFITDRLTVPSISFTIPPSPNLLTGLNFCYVWAPQVLDERLGFVVREEFNLPLIIISNITKNLTWIYNHYLDVVYLGGKCLTFLSHWMFGMNEMECGDRVTITVEEKPSIYYRKAVTKECGVSLVYDDGDTNDVEDVLGYYKSWNHIIGGDLAPLQLPTGAYMLDKWKYNAR